MILDSPRKQPASSQRSSSSSNNNSNKKSYRSSSSSSSQSPYHEASDLLNRILSTATTTTTTTGTTTGVSHHHNQSQLQQLLKRFMIHPKNGTLQISTKTYAIVTKVIQQLPTIDAILLDTNIVTSNHHDHPTITTKQNKNKKKNTANPNTHIKNMGLLYIMVYELLFSTIKEPQHRRGDDGEGEDPMRTTATGGRIKGGGAVKRYLMQREQELRDSYQKLYTGSSSVNEDTDGDATATELFFHHRYVRVNTCASTVPEFLEHYHHHVGGGVVQDDDDDATTNTTRNQAKTSSSSSVSIVLYQDEHIPDLFVIPVGYTSKLLSSLSSNSSSTSTSHGSNNKNMIVLQDKSSCIPAFCLYSLLRQQQQQHARHSYHPVVVLDACAAPGNKTSHIAALLRQLQQVQTTRTSTKYQNKDNNKHFNSKIYAIDRDPIRCQTLQERMKALVPSLVSTSIAISDNDNTTNSKSKNNKNNKSNDNDNTIEVIVQKKDFLSITGQDDDTDDDAYNDVTCIVLDPSCSGSGLYHRSNNNSKSDVDDDDTNEIHGCYNDRIRKLSNFQITCLRHALSSFPNVHTVIYSTCSIHIAENEHVVASVFATATTVDDEENNSSRIRDEWSIVAPPDLSNWKRRGMDMRQRQEQATNGTQCDDANDTVKNDIDWYGDLTAEEINCFIRTTDSDRTNGFFVSCFQRKSVCCSTSTSSSGKSSVVVVVGGRRDQTKQHPTKTTTWNIPIYNGEFDTFHQQKPQDTNASRKRKHDQQQQPSHSILDHADSNNAKANTQKLDIADDGVATTATNQKKKKKAVATNTSTPKSASSQPSSTKVNPQLPMTTSSAATTTKECKKRTKKLEWKQRQHQAKLSRTTNSKSNAVVVSKKDNK